MDFEVVKLRPLDVRVEDELVSADYSVVRELMNQVVGEFNFKVERYLTECLVHLGIQPTLQNFKRISCVIDKKSPDVKSFVLDYETDTQMVLCHLQMIWPEAGAMNFKIVAQVQGIIQMDL